MERAGFMDYTQHLHPECDRDTDMRNRATRQIINDNRTRPGENQTESPKTLRESFFSQPRNRFVPGRCYAEKQPTKNLIKKNKRCLPPAIMLLAQCTKTVNLLPKSPSHEHPPLPLNHYLLQVPYAY